MIVSYFSSLEEKQYGKYRVRTPVHNPNRITLTVHLAWYTVPAGHGIDSENHDGGDVLNTVESCMGTGTTVIPR